jgi:hypothetical protein
VSVVVDDRVLELLNVFFFYRLNDAFVEYIGGCDVFVELDLGALVLLFSLFSLDIGHMINLKNVLYFLLCIL